MKFRLGLRWIKRTLHGFVISIVAHSECLLSFDIKVIYNKTYNIGSIARKRLSIGTYITVKRLIRSILRRRKKMSNVNVNSLVKHQAKASHRDGVIVINGWKKTLNFICQRRRFVNDQLTSFESFYVASLMEIESLSQDVLPNHHPENLSEIHSRVSRIKPNWVEIKVGLSSSPHDNRFLPINVFTE